MPGFFGCHSKVIGFSSMMNDTVDWRIDLIVTKSLSRFVQSTGKRGYISSGSTVSSLAFTRRRWMFDEDRIREMILEIPGSRTMYVSAKKCVALSGVKTLSEPIQKGIKSFFKKSSDSYDNYPVVRNKIAPAP